MTSNYADKLILDRHAMKDRSTSHLRIYVGGITDQTDVDELYEHFIPFGNINGIIINRNFGFVQFEQESSAQEAIIKANGSIFQGKNINVRASQTNPDKRHTEVKTTLPDITPAVALNDNLLQTTKDEGAEDPYDNYGNFIGDQIEAPVRKGRTRTRSRRRIRQTSETSPPTREPSADTSNYREEEYDEGFGGGWKDGRGGRGRGVRGRGRGVRGRGGASVGPGAGVVGGAFRERDRSPVPGGRGEWSDRGAYDRYQPPEYPRALPVTERNDCEIIVVSKTLTEYAEYIEGRLKRLGIVVDLLFPMEDVPIGKVLGNIASRGCLYAILVMPQNQENRSLTLTILHGLPQEHRNMPLEDALQLLSRNFQEVQRGGPSGREAVYALLGQLADGRTLTVLQYDKVIEYLQERKEQQVKIELGEPLATAPATKTQVDLQQRILSILNDKKVTTSNNPTPVKAPSPAPAVAPVSQNKLLNDPTVRKALDSILQKFA